MSGYQKHTTHTDALDTLGTIIDETQKRDAIHLAVEPVVCGGLSLWPGQHVALQDGYAVPANAGAGLGIVDPFIVGPVRPGQRFWLVVYPRQITSLRHVWEHPAFSPSGETSADTPAVAETKEEAELWLREWFERHTDNPGFEAVMAVIETGSWHGEGHGGYDGPSGEYSSWGSYLHFRDTDAHGDIPDEFWDHVDVYLGQPAERVEGFSCAC